MTENEVADRVPEPVIDLLEMVHVYMEKRDLDALLPGKLGQGEIETAPVQETGEVIVIGGKPSFRPAPLQLLVEEDVVRHIPFGADKARIAGRIDEIASPRPQIADRSVRSNNAKFRCIIRLGFDCAQKYFISRRQVVGMDAVEPDDIERRFRNAINQLELLVPARLFFCDVVLPDSDAGCLKRQTKLAKQVLKLDIRSGSFAAQGALAVSFARMSH
ncbi:hypothetical protein GGE45_004179 [Rhizobium aethiopicum]|uniref:Uncharacterized protein n=1 Tax=Rhizobium aethiopicum TaxID=1138170 RepID=A0A7W6VR39_9HYPH|nr:hypothetical protein [Rhizobium aethiopicum]MBB4581826.1 hypothetical protein [Rhizobium aethiopicum]